MTSNLISGAEMFPKIYAWDQNGPDITSFKLLHFLKCKNIPKLFYFISFFLHNFKKQTQFPDDCLFVCILI